jgi:hypothetical protein
MKPRYRWEISVSVNEVQENSCQACSLAGLCLSSSHVCNVCFMPFPVGLNCSYIRHTTKFPSFSLSDMLFFVQEFQMSGLTFMMYFYITLIKYFNYNRDSRSPCYMKEHNKYHLTGSHLCSHIKQNRTPHCDVSSAHI